VAKQELGVKRTCPETGKKFYDLNKDPIVSPYTGKTYPRSFFEEVLAPKPHKPVPAPTPAAVPEPVEAEEEVAGAPEFVSLEEAEGEEEDEAAEGEEIPDIPDVEVEVEDDGAEDETFLADDEEEDENLSGVFDGGKNPEET